MTIIPLFAGASGVLAAVALLFMHGVLAIAINRDASERNYRHQPIHILTRGEWTLVALVGGLAGLALYWGAHYSTLAREK
ncbi:MAG: hypothetical protein HYV95_12920 [Opitutae bacterium]|nr:hypothetical protein [Opitutae bacterium]